MKIFLGGTCVGYDWRKDLIVDLELNDIEYFNPVVDDWTEECYTEELRQRKICDYVLYCITPEYKGLYSIAEAVDDSNKRPSKTIVVFLDVVYSPEGTKHFTESELKSIDAICKMLENNKAAVFWSLESVVEYLSRNS